MKKYQRQMSKSGGLRPRNAKFLSIKMKNKHSFYQQLGLNDSFIVGESVVVRNIGVAIQICI